MSALGNKKVFSENLRRYMALYEKIEMIYVMI